jgi:hypothetical protein
MHAIIIMPEIMYARLPEVYSLTVIQNTKKSPYELTVFMLFKLQIQTKQNHHQQQQKYKKK